MTDRPKIPPGFRDATKEGAAIAVIGDIGRRIGDADKLVAEAGGPRASQSEERRTPAEMSTQTASTATDASGATPPSAPAKPMLRPPKGGTDRTAEAVGKAVAFVGAEAFRPLK